MTMRGINLDTYSLSLLTAKEDILNTRSSTNWALFTYDGVSNKLKLADSGAGGAAELVGKFHISKPQYGLCRVGTAETGGPRIAMISWVGQNVDEYRRTECTSHIPAIKAFFKEAHVFISAEKAEDVTEDKIAEALGKVQSRGPSEWVRRSSKSAQKEEMVGTNYRKTNAAMEMRRINRDSFWARAEREEEERKDEERRRAAEERRRLERERVLKERQEAEERDRKMNEKLQMIEEQRRRQAEQEQELRRQEKTRWEEQQREHEEDMRARLRRSESIEMAAEAAVLVSQRSMNPREFFRQLSSSSQSPLSPGSPRSGKPPLRRYQRSLTDTAFIFSKQEERKASSSRSPPPVSPLISPFSRAPPSPLFRATSPPTSPDFRPIASPQRTRARMISPPPSPVRSAPPASSLPGLPPAGQGSGSPRSSPTQPSAPPASPSLLDSLSPEDHPDHPALPPSPPMTPRQIHGPNQVLPPLPEDTQTELTGFEALPGPQDPTAPLSESPEQNSDLHTATLMQTELVSETGYKVQAVLVEEDGEEEEDEEEKGGDEHVSEPQSIPITMEAIKVVTEREEDEEEEAALSQELEPSSSEQPVELEEDEGEEEDEGREKDQSDPSRTSAEAVVAELSEEEEEEEEPAGTDTEVICQKINHEAVIISTNGITNGEDMEENGIDRSLSPSDTGLSTPELAVCYEMDGKVKEECIAEEVEEQEEEEEEEEEEISENGQEDDEPERQMCVRALYDYQAEDESEISFEPGDIISDVETVDKAWWRGCSKDGRQGLFPANYVETI